MSKKRVLPAKAEQKPKTPCIQISVADTHGDVTTFSASSIFRLGNHLHAQKIDSQFLFMDDPDAYYNLNKIANAAFKNPSVTHLLLLRPDLKFEPDLVIQMLKLNNPFVCIQLPEKTINLHALHDEIVQHGYYPEIQTSEPASFDPEFKSVHSAELGFALIQRAVLQKMVEKTVAPRFLDIDGYDEEDRFRPPPETIYGFFSPLYHKETRDQLHFHDAFCYRWKQLCQGEIRLYQSSHLELKGLMEFKARYRLKSGAENRAI